MGIPTREDVWLCLHLYEQRRETELRAAREWLTHFQPRSFKDVQAVLDGRKDPDANRYWRQATSYWEMIAALMSSGGVSPDGVELFRKTTREWLLHWSKIEPYIDEIRAHTRPTAFQSLEAFCRGMPDYEEAMEAARRMNERIRAAGRRAARGASGKAGGRKKAARRARR